MEDVNVSAASGEWQVTFGEGYTDGTSLVVSMELTGPQELLEQYRCVWVDPEGQTAAVNGETARWRASTPLWSGTANGPPP